MRLGRVTRYALLLVPLIVCAQRLHAQRAAAPATLLQEANRCLSLVRASSRRRQENEREHRHQPPCGSLPTDSAAVHSDHSGQSQDRRAS